jgi:hypothetical protein
MLSFMLDCRAFSFIVHEIHAKNAPGPFHTTSECLACSLPEQQAPDLLAPLGDPGGSSWPGELPSEDQTLTLHDELAAFYERNGFGPVLGSRPRTVPVFTGCLLVPLPNIEARRRYLKYHDLHHLLTGYTTGRIGEGEVSAWELGTGSFLNSPLLGVMNLIALSTGLALQPRRMWRAFVLGTKSRNLYSAARRAEVDSGRWGTVAELRAHCLDVTKPPRLLPLRAAEFALYSGVSMVIHAFIAGPAVVARTIADVTSGESVVQALKPKKRGDLY